MEPRRHGIFLGTHTHLIAYARNAETWHPNPSVVKVSTIWSTADLDGAHEIHTASRSHPAAPYPFMPKPVGLLRRILRIAAGSEALVLDPFAGSGTTAQAVLEQNASGGGYRKFVLIESCRPRPEPHPPPTCGGLGGLPDYGFYLRWASSPSTPRTTPATVCAIRAAP